MVLREDRLVDHHSGITGLEDLQGHVVLALEALDDGVGQGERVVGEQDEVAWPPVRWMPAKG